jgi:hypothetical protein
MSQEHRIDISGLEAGCLQLGQQHAVDAASDIGYHSRVRSGITQSGVHQQRPALRTDQITLEVDPQAVGPISGFRIGVRVPFLEGRPGFQWNIGKGPDERQSNLRIVKDRDLNTAYG